MYRIKLAMAALAGLLLVAAGASFNQEPRKPFPSAITKQAPPPAPDIRAADNPRIKPGDVAWHPDFRAACAAAKQSGKPVLLFQLMGRLDEEQC